jgi:hypothetical protein
MGSPVATIGQFERKNLIINGAFDFSQRRATGSTAITSTGGNYLASDRWLVGHSGVVSPTTQNTGNAVALATKSTRQGSCSGTITAGDFFVFRQRIIADAVRDLALALKSVSLSFIAQSTTMERIRVGLSYPVALNDWSSSTEFYTTNLVHSLGGYEFFSLNDIPLHANCVNGLRLDIQFESVAYAGGVDVHLTEVMLNEGRVVAPFERRGVTLLGEELLCSYYYTKSGRYHNTSNEWVPGSSTKASNAAIQALGFRTTTTRASMNVTFPVPMRVIPTITFYPGRNDVANTANNIAVYNSETLVTFSDSVTRSVSGLSGEFQSLSTAAEAYTLQYTADAEL